MPEIAKLSSVVHGQAIVKNTNVQNKSIQYTINNKSSEHIQIQSLHYIKGNSFYDAQNQ